MKRPRGAECSAATSLVRLLATIPPFDRMTARDRREMEEKFEYLAYRMRRTSFLPG